MPTVTFRVLYVFIVLAHERRRLLHFNVTAHPTSEWTAQQIVEAFPWGSAPGYLLHDRDSIYGDPFRQRLREMGIRDVLTAPRSPWQDSYAERLIGSIRRECLDHIPCTQRIIAAPDSQIVFLLLPAGAHPSGLG